MAKKPRRPKTIYCYFPNTIRVYSLKYSDTIFFDYQKNDNDIVFVDKNSKFYAKHATVYHVILNDGRTGWCTIPMNPDESWILA